MTETVDMWVAGAYLAVVRPGPRQQARQNWVREMVPVSIRSVGADAAPVAIRAEYTSFGTKYSSEYRIFEGRYFTPFHYSERSTSVEAFQKKAISAEPETPFQPARSFCTVEQVTANKGAIVSSERRTFEADMHRKALDVLIVDGLVYTYAEEPRLSVSLYGTPEQVHISFKGRRSHKPVLGDLPVNRMDDVIRVATRLQELNPGSSIENPLSLLEVEDFAPISFDPLSAGDQDIWDSGSGTIRDRDLYLNDDDFIQDMLDLRRLHHGKFADAPDAAHAETVRIIEGMAQRKGSMSGSWSKRVDLYCALESVCQDLAFSSLAGLHL